jgi:hypothetical protein
MIRQLATARLLDPSDEAVVRLQRSIILAVQNSEFHKAKWLMGYRRQIGRQIEDSARTIAALDGLEKSIDWVLANPWFLEAERAARPAP